MAEEFNFYEVKNFIKDVLGEEEFEGCRYLWIDDMFALVFAWVKDDGGDYSLCGKIAYNVDDLRCDYDFDWEMPINPEDEEVIFTEITDIEPKKNKVELDTQAELLTNEFKGTYDMLMDLVNVEYDIKVDGIIWDDEDEELPLEATITITCTANEDLDVLDGYEISDKICDALFNKYNVEANDFIDYEVLGKTKYPI